MPCAPARPKGGPATQLPYGADARSRAHANLGLALWHVERHVQPELALGLRSVLLLVRLRMVELLLDVLSASTGRRIGTGR